ncbi:MAG: class I SAM-dependent methyltransferase [Planctomycetes bacterium]|nr:class I SAM-dependent methyltransferase [Planctomycetota bacterium]
MRQQGWFVLVFGLLQQAQLVQEVPVAPVAPASVAPLRKLYMGRPIAPTMSWEGGPWLMRATREKEERCSELLAALDVKPGQIVCDFGCGNGFYTFPLARLVGAKGKVYATDIQPEMLELLKGEAKKHEGAGDIVVPVLCTETDPKLADASIDLALLVDVYHELSDPAAVLAALKKSLKPDGQLAIVEFRLEDPEVPIKLEHKMTKVQLVKELDANGYVVAREFDQLPWQHVVFFKAKPKEAETPASKPGSSKGLPSPPPSPPPSDRGERR